MVTVGLVAVRERTVEDAAAPVAGGSLTGPSPVQ